MKNCTTNISISKVKKSTELSAPLDTLAQLGTNQENTCSCGDDFEVKATTKKTDKQSLKKRARRKYMTCGYVGALVDASKNNEKSSLQKAYWSTYHCAKTLTLKSDGKVSGRYCKNRWCLVCNSIRTAQLIKRYNPVLSTWQNKYFVTLTIPNLEADDVKESVEVMQKVFTTCKERLRKRAQRGQAERFKGLRKLEVTYNPERNDFHPHYHVLVEGETNAKELLKIWMQTYNKTFQSAIWGEANIKAQDVRKADDNSTLELFKYFTKVISGKEKKTRMIYADAMDIIFNSVKGKRVFQTFGFTVKSEADAEQETDNDTYALTEYEWCQIKADWEADQLVVDQDTGEVLEHVDNLSGHKPSEGLKELINERVVVRRSHSWQRWHGSGVVKKRAKLITTEEEKKALQSYITDGMKIMQRRVQEQRKKERERSVKQLSISDADEKIIVMGGTFNLKKISSKYRSHSATHCHAVEFHIGGYQKTQKNEDRKQQKKAANEHLFSKQKQKSRSNEYRCTKRDCNE
jgi:hypothetical protein